MPLTALNELPLLIGLKSAWRRLVEPKPVLIAFNDTSLVCCWVQGDHWQQRVAEWPEGGCVVMVCRGSGRQLARSLPI